MQLKSAYISNSAKHNQQCLAVCSSCNWVYNGYKNVYEKIDLSMPNLTPEILV